MARRRGWGGSPPHTDEEASARIVAVAVKLIAATGAEVSIADVAAELGVIRQTVYRYFPTAGALMRAAAIASVDGFLDRLADTVRGITDPAEAMTEGVLFTLEDVERTPHLRLVLAAPRTDPATANVMSTEAQELGMKMITRFDVDWASHGYDERALRELVEFILRILVSFFVAPNESTRPQSELRRFLNRWIGSAILAQQR